MTKVLIVDDEHALARGVMRAILSRRRDFSVLTASSGVEAIALLEEQHIDVVVTDLCMNEMDGFELLAWLVNHRPELFALAMTGSVDAETDRRLQRLGSFECLRKPIDIDGLIERINEGVASHVSGHVHNLSLASFLQLVELEKKTCTLEVRSDARVGKLYLRNGELIDATTGVLHGEEAACAIISWPQVSIAIDSSCDVAMRTIERSSGYLIMEAMRLTDEARRTPTVEPSLDESSTWGPTFTTALPTTATPPAHPVCKLDSFRQPVGALVLAVVDDETGNLVLGPDEHRNEAAELVRIAWQMLHHERVMLEDDVAEIAMLTRTRGELVKPIPQLNSFAYLLFDAEKTNLVMARLELDSFVLEYTSAY